MASYQLSRSLFGIPSVLTSRYTEMPDSTREYLKAKQQAPRESTWSAWRDLTRKIVDVRRPTLAAVHVCVCIRDIFPVWRP